MRQKRRRPFFRAVLFLLALGLLLGLGLALFRSPSSPEISIEPAVDGIGRRTPVRIHVAESSRGLGSIRVELVQGDRVHVLAERSHEPLAAWRLWGERVPDDDLALEIGSETVKGLTEGPATIRVTADRAGSLLRRPDPRVEERTLHVRLRPPALQIFSQQVYVSQGGAEAVVYQVGDAAVRDGVQAGEWWFPGYALPGGPPGRHFALFAAPYDLADPSGIRLVATDGVGNEARVSFVDRFTPRPVHADTIHIEDAFLARVVPPILSETPDLADRGNLLDNYLAMNGELRRKNAATLLELSRGSKPEFLWHQAFLPMSGAAVMSSFADRRTYVYQGREVDRQDHLGFDQASTRMAEIQAGNDGVVALARYFGIYGNTVILDHGYGVMTLYGHLSSIAVQEGQTVQRGQAIGRSGDTGLAGGDHLHFAVLLHGLPVDPREWWDSHWISHRLKLKLGAALPFES